MPARRSPQTRSGVLARALVTGACAIGIAAAPVATAPRLATPRSRSRAAVQTPLAAGTVLRVDVALRPRDPSALARFATMVSTPGSPQYGDFLARGRFAAAFGPTQRSIERVTRWLRAEGLTRWSLSANHLTVRVTADAGALERALDVRLEEVPSAADRVGFENTAPPRVPRALASAVIGVVGLSDLVVPTHFSISGMRAPAASGSDRSRPSAVGPQACELAAESASSTHAYTADQLAAAYGFAPLYAAGDEGSGVTVALFEQETNPASDITAYQACYGTSATVRYLKVDGGAPNDPSDGEAAMDIEVALGLAPKASFDVYQAPANLTGALDEYTAIVDDDAAKVVSTSWGQCEAQTGSTLIAAEGLVFEQAAAQGQTVFSASGDDGSEGCQDASLAATDPGSQSFVTSVGGTTLSSVAHGPVERVWNDSSIRTGAGGGGISGWHVMPSYQALAPASLHVVGPDSSGAPCHAPHGELCRETPDVAADADRSTGYIIYENEGWQSNGGTSASSPLWAALAALADASATCRGRTIGFANPALYRAADTSYKADFHDITSGNNDYTPDGNTSGLYPAGPGYDMASGLGTPDASKLVATICAFHARPLPTTAALSLSQGTATYGQEGSVTLSVTVTGKQGDGRPIGTVRVSAGSKLLCSHAVGTTTSSYASRATCALGATALRAGHHELRASFSPAGESSSDPRFAYARSTSGLRSLTVDHA